MTTTALALSSIDASIDDIAPTLTTEQRAMIAPILARYGEPLLRRCAKEGIRLAVISGPYHEASRELANLKRAGSIDVDDPSINLPASQFRLAAYDPNLFALLETLLATGALPSMEHAA